MVKAAKQKAAHRQRKTMSVRRRLRVGGGRPRLSVRRSLKNISCQIIDDSAGRTLVAASSLEKEIRGASAGLKKTEVATRIGALIAERAKTAGVSKIVFDRDPYKYHGRVKALADAAREGGLEF